MREIGDRSALVPEWAGKLFDEISVQIPPANDAQSADIHGCRFDSPALSAMKGRQHCRFNIASLCSVEIGPFPITHLHPGIVIPDLDLWKHRLELSFASLTL